MYQPRYSHHQNILNDHSNQKSTHLVWYVPNGDKRDTIDFNWYLHTYLLLGRYGEVTQAVVTGSHHQLARDHD